MGQWLALLALLVQSSFAFSAETCRVAGEPAHIQKETLGIKLVFECDNYKKDYVVVPLSAQLESLKIIVTGRDRKEVTLSQPPGSLGDYLHASNNSWVVMKLKERGVNPADAKFFLGDFKLASGVQLMELEKAFWDKLCKSGRVSERNCRDRELSKMPIEELIRQPGTKIPEIPDGPDFDPELDRPRPVARSAQPKAGQK